MYEELTDAEYWKIADRKIARLHLSEEDMEKVIAWRSTSDRNVLQLWEIYDDVLTLRIRLEEPIKALREYTIPHPSYRDPDERTMFALRQPPPKLTDWQDYIVLAKERRDVSFFLHFLHYYEPVLNTRTAKFAERYDLKPYFADLKMTVVAELWKSFLVYDVFSGVPFLTFCARDVRDAMHELARTVGSGFTSKSLTGYYRLRKIAYRYQNRGEQTTEAFIRETAEDLKLTEKTVMRYLEEIEARNHFVDFYRVDEEDDEDFTGEDVTVDHEPTPDILVPRLLEGDKIDKALSGLSRRELDLIEGRFGFCATCFQNKETLSFDDLADKYQFTTEEGAEKAFVRAFEAFLRGLVDEDYCHAVTLDKAGDTPKKRVIRYRYQPDFLGDPGEIEFDLRHPACGAFTVLKLAETDVTGVFAEQAAKIVAKMQAKEYQLLENDTAPEVAWKVYIKHKAFVIRNESIPNVTPENAVPDFPRKVIYRTASETETEWRVTYFPEDVREKKNTEDYGQPIVGGTIIGTPTDDGWEWAVTCPAELDTCESRIYANAVIEYLAKCAEKGILIPSGCVWFRKNNMDS